MSSTTYRHLGDVSEMFAAQKQFRDITKLVTKRHQFVVLGNMVRNAGHCGTDTLQPDGDRLPAERH